jgi:hypothetical protein
VFRCSLASATILPSLSVDAIAESAFHDGESSRLPPVSSLLPSSSVDAGNEVPQPVEVQSQTSTISTMLPSKRPRKDQNKTAAAAIKSSKLLCDI